MSSGIIGAAGSKSGIIGPIPSFSLGIPSGYSIAGDVSGLLYFNTVYYDIGSNITSTSDYSIGSVFTAPRPGHYQFNFAVRLDSISDSCNHVHAELRTDMELTRFAYSTIIRPEDIAESEVNYWGFSASHCTNMTAGAKAWVQTYGNASGSYTVSHESGSFSGFLIRE